MPTSLLTQPQPRSYVLRTGRLTAAQRRALGDLWPRYGLSVAPGAGGVDFAARFGREVPLWLEIGFGDGAALLELAQQHPRVNFIGVEVHRPGVGRLLLTLHKQGLNNLRLFCQDAVEVLQFAVADGALARINLFFPDPWPKKRHHKRRIVRADFVDLVCRKLARGGVFHFATDWQEYAEQALLRLEADARLTNTAGAGQFAAGAVRPRTKFEGRGQRLGHSIADIVMRRV